MHRKKMKKRECILSSLGRVAAATMSNKCWIRSVRNDNVLSKKICGGKSCSKIRIDCYDLLLMWLFHLHLHRKNRGRRECNRRCYLEFQISHTCGILRRTPLSTLSLASFVLICLLVREWNFSCSNTTYLFIEITYSFGLREKCEAFDQHRPILDHQKPKFVERTPIECEFQ